VVAVLASTESDKVDPRVQCIADEVRKIHPRFKGFRLAVMTCKSLPVQQKTSIELLDKQSVDVTILHGADDQNWVALKVKPPCLGEVEYRSVCGKFFPMVTGWKTEQGERLIVAVRVQPCNGGK